MLNRSLIISVVPRDNAAGTHSIISHITGGHTQVNYGGSFRAESCKHMDMGHDIMTRQLLLSCCLCKINIIDVRLHLRNLIIGDGQSQLLKKKTIVYRICLCGGVGFHQCLKRSRHNRSGVRKLLRNVGNHVLHQQDHNILACITL